MDDRSTARSIAAGRVLFGLLCLFVPKLVLGRVAREASGPMLWMVRAFGIRDTVLGAGALAALADGNDEVRWVAIGALADTADLTTAVVRRDELGGRNFAATVSLALPAAALGWKSVRGLRAR